MRTTRLLLALVVIALVAVGCAQPAPTATPKPAPTTAQAQPTKAAATAVPATQAPAAKPFRIAMVTPSAKNDLAFSQSMYDALVAVQKEMGKDKVEFAYSEGMTAVADAAAAIRDYASKGYDLVLAHGSQYGSSLPDIAKDFPKTAFAWGTTVDTFESKGVKNVFAYTVNSDEGAYVEGVIAAMMSKSGIVGAIGPVAAGDGKRTIDGFAAGVTATKPSVKVQTQFTGSFSDVALASQAAQTQISSGADALTGSGQMVVGAISVAKDKKVLWFGNQASQTSLAPDVVVANQVYDWSGVLKDMMDNIRKGTLGAKVYTLTLKNGGIKMEYNSKVNLPADVKAAADKAAKGLADGTISTGVK